MAERVTTGLAGLDAQLGGGVPKGTVHVVLGEPMNAQEILCNHLAAGGSLVGGGCAYFVADRPENEVRQGVQAVGGRPERVHVLGTPYKGQWALPDMKPGLRYVVDSYSDIILKAGFQAAMSQLKRLKQQTRTNGDNLFLNITSGLHSEAELLQLRVWADGVLELGFDRQGFGLYPYLKMTKMRGVPESARFLLFRETDRGLFMESTRRVF